MTDDIILRGLDAADLPEVLTLNNDASPHVNALEERELAAIVAMATVAIVADAGEGIAGFVLALALGAEYESENYRWFSRRSGLIRVR